ncbi:hypothetical protein ACLOJK_008472 [Asimina triloba]
MGSVLELGMNFLSADDMSAILAVKLRKRLGFGIWAKMHITGMHIEGKVLVGVKFLRDWPFLGRLRICFVEPPYFQMTVKPIFNHGVDVTELPGIAGWLDNILAGAFEQTLVEVSFRVDVDATEFQFQMWAPSNPNMLVVDVEKFVSAPTETWFSMHEKHPIAYARVEILEAAEMKPSDMNGLADPYVKGSMGQYMFRTNIQKKTLSPKWQEEFKVPISSWESPNVLLLKVHDKDHFVDDSLGGGHRHDKWLPLKNIKTGRLHLAITVIDVDEKEREQCNNEELPTKNEKAHVPVQTEANKQEQPNHKSSLQASRLGVEFEPINVEGLEHTGIWVQHPGTQGSQTWEPRKRRSSRRPEIRIHREDINPKDVDSKENLAAAIGSNDSGDSNSTSSDEEFPEGNKVRPIGTIKRNLLKLGSVFSRGPKNECPKNKEEEVSMSDVGTPAVGDRGNDIMVPLADSQDADKESLIPDKCEAESPSKSHMKGMAKSFLKQAGKSAHSLKHALSKKESRKSKDGPGSGTADTDAASQVSDSIDEESPSSTKEISPCIGSSPVDPASPLGRNKESPTALTAIEENAVEVDPLPSPKMLKGPPVRKVSFRAVVMIDDKDGEDGSPTIIPIRDADFMDDEEGRPTIIPIRDADFMDDEEGRPTIIPIRDADFMDDEEGRPEESLELEASVTDPNRAENEGMLEHSMIDSGVKASSPANANEEDAERREQWSENSVCLLLMLLTNSSVSCVTAAMIQSIEQICAYLLLKVGLHITTYPTHAPPSRETSLRIQLTLLPLERTS